MPDTNTYNSDDAFNSDDTYEDSSSEAAGAAAPKKRAVYGSEDSPADSSDAGEETSEP